MQVFVLIPSTTLKHLEVQQGLLKQPLKPPLPIITFDIVV